MSKRYNRKVRTDGNRKCDIVYGESVCEMRGCGNDLNLTINISNAINRFGYFFSARFYAIYS